MDPWGVFLDFIIEDNWVSQIFLIIALFIGPGFPMFVYACGFPCGPRKSVPRTIERMFIYPIKGCRGIEVEESRLHRHGLEGDRAYILVNPDKKSENGRHMFVNTREWGGVNQIAITKFDLYEREDKDGKTVSEGENAYWKERIPKNGIELLVDGKKLHVPLKRDESKMYDIDIWGEDCTGYDQGDEVAKFLSDWLKKYHNTLSADLVPRCRLVYFDTRPTGQKNERRWGQGKVVESRYHDGFPLLVVSKNTLTRLEKGLSLDHLEGKVDHINPYEIDTSKSKKSKKDQKGKTGKAKDEEKDEPYLHALLRYRPNLVLGTENDDMREFEEDYYNEIIIGGPALIDPTKPAIASIYGSKTCSRCSVTQVHPGSGKRDRMRIMGEMRKIGRDVETLKGWWPNIFRLSPFSLLSDSGWLGRLRIWMWKNVPATFLFLNPIHYEHFQNLVNDGENGKNDVKLGMNGLVECPLGPIGVKAHDSLVRVKFE